MTHLLVQDVAVDSVTNSNTMQIGQKMDQFCVGTYGMTKSHICPIKAMLK
jgi:hypothetical protein